MVECLDGCIFFQTMQSSTHAIKHPVQFVAELQQEFYLVHHVLEKLFLHRLVYYVKKHFEGICNGKVERFDLPNIRALNFLLQNTLGGGGTVSLKHDAQGKTLAAALLRIELDV